MGFCMNCGAQLPDGTKFCPSCGTAQAAPQQAPQTQPVYEQPVYQQPVYQQPAQNMYQQPAAPVVKPKKKKTGLIIAVVILILLSIAAAVATPILLKQQPKKIAKKYLEATMDKDAEELADIMFPGKYYEGAAKYFSEEQDVDMDKDDFKEAMIDGMQKSADDDPEELVYYKILDVKKASSKDIKKVKDLYHFKESKFKIDRGYIVKVKLKWEDGDDTETETQKVLAYQYKGKWYALAVADEDDED